MIIQSIIIGIKKKQEQEKIQLIKQDLFAVNNFHVYNYMDMHTFPAKMLSYKDMSAYLCLKIVIALPQDIFLNAFLKEVKLN